MAGGWPGSRISGGSNGSGAMRTRRGPAVASCFPRRLDWDDYVPDPPEPTHPECRECGAIDCTHAIDEVLDAEGTAEAEWDRRG